MVSLWYVNNLQTRHTTTPIIKRSVQSTTSYSNFSFQLKKIAAEGKARLGLINTPHGAIETPNFIFCATKAAMKAVTPKQIRDSNAQVILSNTYHLMLTPGSQIIEKMGGLQKFTGWNGPMLTDSGGYQIFSMGHGSVSNEIKGKRGSTNSSVNKQSLLHIDENGATFKSYVDNVVHTLTPEKSIRIQRQLGADLIVVLDECTPFNVDKKYTVDSMERSHRWALRSLEEFQRLEREPKYTGRQALYGIVQGGIYQDLRDASCAFVNDHDFFGTAIGGSLGATRRDMYDIVAYTRSRCRDDRPVHLLGIGGVRDIFHGVKQGIDTFDCVHPSRMARHGGALVLAAHWAEDALERETTPLEMDFALNQWRKVASRSDERQIAFYHALSAKKKSHLRDALMSISHGDSDSCGTESGTDGDTDSYLKQFRNPTVTAAILSYAEPEYDEQKFRELCVSIAAEKSNSAVTGAEVLCGGCDHTSSPASTITHSAPLSPPKTKSAPTTNKGQKQQKIRENILLSNSQFRSDPRPIDSTCGCYTCQTFSRAYLHHCFKAGESVGGSLVTIHNVFFMNRLMAAIRSGIANDTLDAVEAEFVHPALRHSNMDGLLSEGIGA